ncbi:MAG: FecR domain-containing protein [Candidatus Eremiobacteraeota bacterium]|nr:FecR domain-containing protein [Candidatus Eremiobacteraeota bacterium]
MDHNIVKEKIYELIEFEVSDTEHEEMLRHIGSCPGCKEEYDTAVRLNSLYKSHSMEPLPQGFYDRLYAKLPVDPRIVGNKEKGNWWESFNNPMYFFRNFFPTHHRLSLVLAAIFMIAVGLFFFIQHTAPPHTAPPSPGLSEPAMYLSFSNEDVEFYDKNTDSWKSDDKVMELKVGDKLKTKKSHAIVAIDKANNIRLAPDTEIEVAKMSKIQKKTLGKLKLMKGRVWIEEKTAVSLMVEAGNYLVKPIGTQYDVYRDNTGKTTVSVYQGKVEVELLSTGKKIDLEAGEKFTSYQTKKKSKKQIEKINPDTVGKSKWYEWNRKVEIPKLPGTGYKIAKPTLRKNLPSPPPWVQAQQGSQRSAPLMLPHSQGDWQKFKQQRQEWRQTHRRSGRAQKRSGIPQVKPGVKSIPQYPGARKTGGERRSRIPGEKGQKGQRGIRQLPGSQKGAGQIPHIPGQTRLQHKGQRKLPHAYPDNSNSLPSNARQNLRHKRMRGTQRRDEFQRNPGIYKGRKPGMQKGGSGRFKRPPGTHKSDRPADEFPTDY